MEEYLEPIITIIDNDNKDSRYSVYEFIDYFYHFNFQETNKNNIVVAVYDKNKNIIVGACIMYKYKKDNVIFHHISYICIDPKYYRNKIGSSILSYIIDKFKTNITLNILISDIHLLKFYQSVCDKKKIRLEIL